VFGEENIIYADECGVGGEYQREYGWSPIGERVHGTKRGKRGKRTNIVGGFWGSRHIAVQCCSQAVRSFIFEDWFEHELAAVIPCGSLVILDNASWHRRKYLYSIAARHGINLLFLPKYSPDFSRIEPSWANFTRWLCDNSFRFPSIVFAADCYFSSLCFLFLPDIKGVKQP
jgi:transposase